MALLLGWKAIGQNEGKLGIKGLLAWNRAILANTFSRLSTIGEPPSGLRLLLDPHPMYPFQLILRRDVFSQLGGKLTRLGSCGLVIASPLTPSYGSPFRTNGVP